MPPARRRGVAPAVVAVLSFLAAVVGVAVPAAGADNPEYVALGDSYASGVGTRSSDGSGCYRSPYAYPVLDAARIGAALTFAACSGARVADVVNNQLGGLDGATRWVMITVAATTPDSPR